MYACSAWNSLQGHTCSFPHLLKGPGESREKHAHFFMGSMGVGMGACLRVCVSGYPYPALPWNMSPEGNIILHAFPANIFKIYKHSHQYLSPYCVLNPQAFFLSMFSALPHLLPHSSLGPHHPPLPSSGPQSQPEHRGLKSVPCADREDTVQFWRHFLLCGGSVNIN